MKNVSYERYKFFSRAQESGKTIGQYVIVSRKLSETCEFSTLKNSVIKDRIILGISDTETRERLLRISDLTLEKAIDVVRSADATEIQLRDMANDPAVHGIGVAKKKKHHSERRPQPTKIVPAQARYLIAETVAQDMV